MRYLWYLALGATLLLGSSAQAQDQPKPDDYKKLYEDTLLQLKAAQDRRADLANDNSKLTDQIAAMQKQHDADQAEIMDLKTQIASFSERSFFLHAHYNAWTRFLAANPMVGMQWDLFLSHQEPIYPGIALPMIDPNWPLLSNP